jgi:hypothetical protein
MSWGFYLYHTAASIKEMIEKTNTDAVGLKDFRLDPDKDVFQLTPAPALGECIFAYILFETKLGKGRGIVNLRSSDASGNEWKAFTFFTSLQELTGHEERKGSTRPKGFESTDKKTWLDRRTEMQQMEGMEPTVLVIGAGHSGLNIAARLGMLDIPTLVIEKNERVGDNWRKRYKTYNKSLLSLIEQACVARSRVVRSPPIYPIPTTLAYVHTQRYMGLLWCHL